MMRTAVFSFPFTLKNIQLSSSSSSSSSSYSCHYLNSFNFDRPPPGLCLTQKLLRPQLHHFKVLTPVGKSIRCSSTTNNSQGASAADDHFFHQTQDFNQQRQGGFWNKWKENSAEMSAKLAKLGLAAVLAYGLFDGFTYTSFFVLAFLGYEKSTGKNPATNLQALLGIVIMMWAGNNVTRPFRVTGAAALAPFVDQSLRRIQKYFNFPNLVYAFALVVALVAGSCFTVIGLLILSRWGK